MRSAARKTGNSSELILPKPFLEEIGLQAGDEVEINVEGGQIVIAPLRKHLRAGWAEDARRIGAGDEPMAWPEFGNDDETVLNW